MFLSLRVCIRNNALPSATSCSGALELPKSNPPSLFYKSVAVPPSAHLFPANLIQTFLRYLFPPIKFKRSYYRRASTLCFPAPTFCSDWLPKCVRLHRRQHCCSVVCVLCVCRIHSISPTVVTCARFGTFRLWNGFYLRFFFLCRSSHHSTATITQALFGYVLIMLWLFWLCFTARTKRPRLISFKLPLYIHRLVPAPSSEATSPTVTQTKITLCVCSSFLHCVYVTV